MDGDCFSMLKHSFLVPGFNVGDVDTFSRCESCLLMVVLDDFAVFVLILLWSTLQCVLPIYFQFDCWCPASLFSLLVGGYGGVSRLILTA